MKDLKESNPVEVAEFALERGIESEHTFVWRVSLTLGKRNRIIYAVIAITKMVSHNYGFQLPSTFQ